MRQRRAIYEDHGGYRYPSDIFEKYVMWFEFDISIGKGEALNSIAKIKKDGEAARLLVRVCCAIGAADGDFDNDENDFVLFDTGT